MFSEMAIAYGVVVVRVNTQTCMKKMLLFAIGALVRESA